MLQLHHAISQQSHRPALVSIRSLATRQGNQLRLSLAIQAPLFGAFAWEAAGESHFQILLHKALLDADHSATTDGEHFGNLPIGGLWLTPALITHQQDARYQVVLGWSLTGMYHCLQPSALFLAQFHRVAIVKSSHRGALSCFKGERTCLSSPSCYRSRLRDR